MSNNNWKKYGGINKSDQLHNLSTGTLVADSLLLRQVNYTSQTVDGELNVTQGVGIQGDLIVGGLTEISQRLTVNSDILSKGKLYFGNTISAPYLYGTGGAGTGLFGLNTPSPTSSLDVTGSIPNILRIHTSGTSIKSILAETTSGSGITSEITGGGSTIGFYSGNVSSSVAIPNTSITSNSNNITISSVNNTIASSGSTTLNSNNGDTTIYSLNATNISSKNTNISSTTGNTIINTRGFAIIDSSGSNTIRTTTNTIISSGGFLYIDSSGSNTFNTSTSTTINSLNGNTIINSINGNTIINSSILTDISSANVVMTSTGVINNVMGEFLTIYDTSNTAFLYDYYQINGSKTGKTVTMVAKDNSSNTFINITAPNKGGLSIGGGAYINDYTRAMGTIGMTSTTGNYVQSQLIISGNNLVKYRTTTGINTYAPKTENYILDINGATRIGNGELTNVLNSNNEILFMKFSKRAPDTGYSVGTPSSAVSKYTNNLAYTSNGGKSWTSTQIQPTGSSLYDTVINFCLYPYDSNYAFIAGSNTNWFFYTNNGGSSWTQIVDTLATTLKQFKTIYVYNKSANNYRFFLGGFLTASNTIGQLFYCDVTNLTPSSVTFSSYNTNVLTSINDSDGSGDFMFLVGNGIQKFNISGSTPSSPYSIKNSNTYNSIYCFDSNYAIAVGNGIISYTTTAYNDTATWTDITTGIGNLRSIFIYDLLNAVAVGDSGLILYTTNGSQTWQPVLPYLLNTSGVANLITNTTQNLRSIFMPDLNSFVIADVSSSYITNSSSGYSKIFYGYYPNLFNRANNNVLDVSGNMKITGDIIIDGSGQLRTLNQYFYLLNDTVQFITMGTTTSTITVGGNSTLVQIPGKLFVNGDASFNTRVIVGSDVSLGGRLFVQGTSVQTGDASFNTRVIVGSDVSLGGRLFVQGTTAFGNAITTDASFNSRVIVGSDVSLGGRLFVQGTSVQNGDASFNSRVIVGSDISLGGRLFVFGTTAFGNAITTDASFNNRVIVGSDISLGGRLFVFGTTAFGNAITTDASFNTRVIVGSDVSLGGRLFVQGDSTMNGNLLLKGNLIVQQAQNQNIINTTVNNYQLIITEDLSLNGRLSTSGDVSMGGNLFVTKPIMSPCYDTSADTITLGSYGSTGKTINIRSYTYVAGSPSTINLGNYTDKINIQGNVTFTNFENLLVKSKIIQLNAGSTQVNTSYGTGIQIQDSTNTLASYIITNGTSTDIRGYNFKATNSNNVLLLDVASMTLNSNKSGMVSLVKSTDLQSYLSDSSYALTVNNNIDCNWNGSNNFYISTKTYLNSDVSMNANVFIPKGNMVFGKQTQTQNTTTQAITGPFIDISGTVNQSGVVFQF